ncbi:hypothetical protein SeMB42_g02137, partial [Synchytrium endobioticum]
YHHTLDYFYRKPTQIQFQSLSRGLPALHNGVKSHEWHGSGLFVTAGVTFTLCYDVGDINTMSHVPQTTVAA